MPVQNLYKAQETNMAPDVVRRPDPQDEYTPKVLETLANDVSGMVSSAAVGKAQEALESGERERENIAQTGLDSYKQQLFKAASAQDAETFGRFYSDAQRIRAATMQGIMSPSTAQLRINKIEKDLAFAHPHLAGDLRAAASAISGNASQLAAMVKEDPAAKAMEDLFKEATKNGFTPNEYMSYNRRKSMVELAQQEVSYAASARAYNAQEYASALSRQWSLSNTIAGFDFIRGLETHMRANAGSMSGADAKAQIIAYKEQLRAKRTQEIDGIISKHPEADRKALVDVLEADLAWLDRQADTFVQGKSYTLEDMKARLDYQTKSMELADKQDYKAWVASLGLAPWQAKIFENDRLVYELFTKTIAYDGAIKANPALAGNPAIAVLKGDSVLAHTIMGDLKAPDAYGRDRSQLLADGFGAGVWALVGGGGGPEFLSPEAQQLAHNVSLEGIRLKMSEDPAAAAGMLKTVLTNGKMTTSKIATFENDGVNSLVRLYPEAKLAYDQATVNEIAAILGDSMLKVQIGGGDPLTNPFQYRSGTTPNSRDNQAILDANSILKNYQKVNPSGYMDLLAEIQQQINPPKPKQQESGGGE